MFTIFRTFSALQLNGILPLMPTTPNSALKPSTSNLLAPITQAGEREVQVACMGAIKEISECTEQEASTSLPLPAPSTSSVSTATNVLFKPAKAAVIQHDCDTFHLLQ